MKRRVAVLLAGVLTIGVATPALAWEAPPTGECVSIQLDGRHATVAVRGPADAEAWIRQGGEWRRADVTFDGVLVPGGYRWVPESATVEVELPPGGVEFRLAVRSTNKGDDTCYVALPAAPTVPAVPTAPLPTSTPTSQVPPAPAVKPASRKGEIPTVRVGIRKIGPQRVIAGDRANYRIRVENPTSRRVRFTVVDRLPSDVVLTKRPAGWDIQDRTVRVPVVLRAKETRTIIVPVRLLSGAEGRRCNTAAIRGERVIAVSSRTCAQVTRRVGQVLPAVTG